MVAMRTGIPSTGSPSAVVYVTYITHIDGSKIKSKVINNFASLDGQTFFDRLDEAIASGKFEELRGIWEYIKNRRRRLRESLDDSEKDKLDQFIASKRAEWIFILKRGDLEAYLPEGHRTKDIDKLIRFLSGSDFFAELDKDARDEIEEICSVVFAR
jgi:putative ATP-dependent endonuclease of OLD family